MFMRNPFVIGVVFAVLAMLAAHAYNSYEELDEDDAYNPVFMGLAAGSVALAIGFMASSASNGAVPKSDVMYEAFEPAS